MSKTHSTIRSKIEGFEDSEINGEVKEGTQSQSIKSIIITKKTNNSI